MKNPIKTRRAWPIAIAIASASLGCVRTTHDITSVQFSPIEDRAHDCTWVRSKDTRTVRAFGITWSEEQSTVPTQLFYCCAADDPKVAPICTKARWRNYPSLDPSRPAPQPTARASSTQPEGKPSSASRGSSQSAREQGATRIAPPSPPRIASVSSTLGFTLDCGDGVKASQRFELPTPMHSVGIRIAESTECTFKQGEKQGRVRVPAAGELSCAFKGTVLNCNES